VKRWPAPTSTCGHWALRDVRLVETHRFQQRVQRPPEIPAAFRFLPVRAPPADFDGLIRNITDTRQRQKGSGDMFATEPTQEYWGLFEPLEGWESASCRDDNGSLAELFFSEQIPHILRAKEICHTCPLIGQCLEGATSRREPWGVWGGELFMNGRILSHKRKRGRPSKNQPAGVPLTA
jgi:WhiB family redox-sensing transcriptional regulator